MKFINFSSRTNFAVRCGCVVGDMCVDLTRAAIAGGPIHFPTAISKFEDVLRFEGGLTVLQEQLPRDSQLPPELHPFAIPLSEIKLAAPILNPQKVIGIGFNYRDHA